MNVIFLWLVVALGITYQRWREAVKKHKELEDIISSINADVLVVVDRNRNIIMCNPSVKSMYGFNVNEVLHQKIDLLYSESYTDTSKKNELTAKLERDGFYVIEATGKKTSLLSWKKFRMGTLVFWIIE